MLGATHTSLVGSEVPSPSFSKIPGLACHTLSLLPVTLFIVFITRTSTSLARRGSPQQVHLAEPSSCTTGSIHTLVYVEPTNEAHRVSLLYNLCQEGDPTRSVSGFDISSLKLQILSQILLDSEKLLPCWLGGFSKHPDFSMVFFGLFPTGHPSLPLLDKPVAPQYCLLISLPLSYLQDLFCD